MAKVGKCVKCEANRILKAGDICKRCSSGLQFVLASQKAEVAA